MCSLLVQAEAAAFLRRFILLLYLSILGSVRSHNLLPKELIDIHKFEVQRTLLGLINRAGLWLRHGCTVGNYTIILLLSMLVACIEILRRHAGVEYSRWLVQTVTVLLVSHQVGSGSLRAAVCAECDRLDACSLPQFLDRLASGLCHLLLRLALVLLVQLLFGRA